MASLYTHKDSNIRKTWALFTVFLIVVIGIGYIFSYVYDDVSILYIAVIFSVFMSFTSYWFSDRIVLSMTRAIPVEMSNHPELYRLVENLSITAGLPMPRIYLVPEAQANAFATGRDPEHAVIAVTQGLLEKLDKSELEGVLAHELSHIGNRDMLVGTMAVVLVGFISILSDIFLRSMFWRGGRRSSSREGNAGAILFIIGLVLAILAPISAKLIQLAISRKREFLADASGALLTRYPDGLVRALEKIRDDRTPMKVATNTTAHLWLDDPFNEERGTSWLHKLFMTHPPIDDRIKALRGINVG
ncbi:MAG: zinc metalloprotease HtpX [Candidatus Colwellbacteria bacterium RIFCSPLOWO2_12_FULL_44_13]|uniref:Protease HtpX homolog n=3 Tax=Candidatus Colwelliibacteriota TaxID=1817904 RepID=A0A1G1Z9Q8_9BACT|nr:MAG: zinc metalloprotease HtpX [Candidatus Colwellbacteria bacterium RIFCSPHIGHO2_12_FULL_44_17]OGY60816.1 MAG: zinc metalloprotease HtpX [Candidatus Colwellbacteria bacterium RIFCSPLOWO2_02_FULL_44_20b]OGY62014.1 MAG: zinc metalloprotease HtpX [Candidatus Colwellbacteria bacterium RIFCSPLOWO2_12_FULL_44_13]